MKYAFYTLGCKVNQYETQAMEPRLTAPGPHCSVPFDRAAATAYIVNTCTVTAVSGQENPQRSSASCRKAASGGGPRRSAAATPRLDPEAVAGSGCGSSWQARPGGRTSCDMLDEAAAHPARASRDVDNALRRRQL